MGFRLDKCMLCIESYIECLYSPTKLYQQSRGVLIVTWLVLLKYNADMTKASSDHGNIVSTVYQPSIHLNLANCSYIFLSFLYSFLICNDFSWMVIVRNSDGREKRDVIGNYSTLMGFACLFLFAIDKTKTLFINQKLSYTMAVLGSLSNDLLPLSLSFFHVQPSPSRA